MLLAAWTWCALGIALGFAAYLAKAEWIPAEWYRLSAPHRHMLLVGFLLQWICAVAYWIYPGVRDRLDRAAAEFTWWMLNGGTLLRAMGEGTNLPRLGAMGAGLQATGAIVFIVLVAFRRLGGLKL